jgi:hypothetical protein
MVSALQERRFQKEPDTVAVAARWIARVRLHIERDGCLCCKKAILGVSDK